MAASEAQQYNVDSSLPVSPWRSEIGGLIQQTFDYGKDVLDYTGAELSWTLEENDMINRSIERVGGDCYKTYRIYEKSLSEPPQA